MADRAGRGTIRPFGPSMPGRRRATIQGKFMPLSVMIHYRDGSSVRAEEQFGEVGDAARFALKLADDLGRTATPYSRRLGHAVSVSIMDQETVVLVIRVFMGGLSPIAPVEGLISLPFDRD
jgi:hypothetical protein